MYKNKTFSILGDSISTFKGYIPDNFESFFPFEGYEVNSVEMTWWKLLEKKLELNLLVNGSYSGSRISRTGFKHPQSSAFISEGRQSILGGDIIIVFGGTNDFGQAEDQATFDTFTKAYNLLVFQLIEKFPLSEIYFCTPLQRTDFELNQKNTKGWTQLDMAKAIRTCVKGKSNKAKLIDLFSYNIQKEDGTLQDNIHPTCKGMKIIYSIVKDALGK
ncbi:MAG: SGNH/GDSL hydrolase family protein [Sphaerochaetaceae bacterium]